MAKESYIEEVPFTLGGIPCLIGVISCTIVEPNSRADSDMDYYGYTETEWDILDRKGYRAKWLDYKIDDDAKEEIEVAIVEAMSAD